MLEALLSAVRDNATGDARDLREDHAELAASAPEPIAELITLMGTRNVRLPLGWRSIESRYLASLTSTWELVDDPESDDSADALVQGVQIGASAGGEVYFGLCWSDDGIRAVEIDFEECFMTWYDTVEAFFEAVRDDDTMRTDDTPRGLAAIFAAAGQPLE